VASLMNSPAAASELLAPAATSSSTSSSRVPTGVRRGAGRSAGRRQRLVSRRLASPGTRVGRLAGWCACGPEVVPEGDRVAEPYPRRDMLDGVVAGVEVGEAGGDPVPNKPLERALPGD